MRKRWLVAIAGLGWLAAGAVRAQDTTTPGGGDAHSPARNAGESTSPTISGAYGALLGDANAVTAGGGNAAGGVGIDVGGDAFSLFVLYQFGTGTTVTSDDAADFFNTVCFPYSTPGSFAGDLRLNRWRGTYSAQGFKLAGKYAMVKWALENGTTSHVTNVFAASLAYQAAWDFSKMVGGPFADQRIIGSVDIGPAMRGYHGDQGFVDAQRPGSPDVFFGVEGNVELYVRKVRAFLTITWLDHGSVPGIGGLQAMVGAGIRGEILGTK